MQCPIFGVCVYCGRRVQIWTMVAESVHVVVQFNSGLRWCWLSSCARGEDAHVGKPSMHYVVQVCSRLCA